MAEVKTIRFRFAPAKALAAIHWMVAKKTDLDLHTMLKSCYFADKAHLNEHGRPIFGATYRAMRFGPVPLEIYEMAKGEALWLAELDRPRYPWELDGFKLRLRDNAVPALDALSKSDLIALKEAFRNCRAMTFNQRTSATHGPDWRAAELGIMKYEDMIADSRKKKERVAYLREAAPFMRL